MTNGQRATALALFKQLLEQSSSKLEYDGHRGSFRLTVEAYGETITADEAAACAVLIAYEEPAPSNNSINPFVREAQLHGAQRCNPATCPYCTVGVPSVIYASDDG